MTTVAAKKLLLEWFEKEFDLHGEALWMARKLTQSSILKRLHFVRDVRSKQYGVYIFIGDLSWTWESGMQVEKYEQMVKVYINGQSVNYRFFIESILRDRDADIHVNLDYDGCMYCSRLESVIEPTIPISDLLNEVEKDYTHKKVILDKIDEAIDRALDKRNFELVKALNDRKQTLIRKEPLL